MMHSSRLRPSATLMRSTMLILALSAVVSAGTDADSPRRRARSHSTEHSIKVGDLERRYLLHSPESLATGQRVPLVLVFHGGGGHARNMPRFTGFDRAADASGFIVAYPDSFNKHWNDTRGLSPADDVAFVRAMIDELERIYPIDPKRVYATGISNGGFFVQRLACDLTDKIAAVASVAATMPETLVPICHPSRPISVMFIHGTEDTLVPINGGVVARGHGRNVSLDAATKYWRDWNRTSGTPSSEDLADRDPHDGTRIHRDTYAGGKNGTEVVVFTVRGGGHTWPGASQYLPAFLVGRASRDMDATEVIWQFFQQQSAH